MKAVIQAGGKGTRLRPYTLVLPKPMMPVGELPVIEMLLKWLRRNGIREAFVTTGYLGHLIRSLCGDGKQWDMSLTYSEEPEPLGTVGALDLLRNELNGTFLVLNGDLITDLDLRALIASHKKSGNMLTVATTCKRVKIDLGVVDCEGGRIVGFREKPSINYQVSMGVYVMEPEILNQIPCGVPFGIDDLVLNMLDEDLPMHTYMHNGMWMDIGRPEDFQKAQIMFEESGQPMLSI